MPRPRSITALPPLVQAELLGRIRSGKQSRRQLLAWLAEVGNGNPGMSYSTLGRLSRRVRGMSLVALEQRENARAILMELEGVREREGALLAMLAGVLAEGV